jgi:hypothetical protein
MDRPERQPQAEQSFDSGQQPRRVERTVPHHEQPEFLRRPVRRPRREGNGGPADEAAPAASAPAGDDNGRE